MSADHSTKHIVQSLVANLIIAIAKGVAAFFTGSGAMLAEAIHSAADCTNQVLLLVGVKRGRKEPDATHPLGYGREVYFWSFMVAMLLFTGGGAFSVYEGIHKIQHPEPIENVNVGIGVLGLALAIEGWATLSNIKDLNKRRGSVPFFQYLRRTKDSDLVVVFGENSAATLGLVLALITLIVAWTTGEPMWDGVGSLLVGIVLILVAVFLAIEVKALLVGESADPDIEAAVKAEVKLHPNIDALLRLLSVQQGPGEILLLIKLRLKTSLSAEEVVSTINGFEDAIRAKHPEAKWFFVEPDHEA